MADGDTYDTLWESSEIPFPSPSDLTPGGLPQGFSGGGENPVLSTMGTAVHVQPSGDVKTHFKYGPGNSVSGSDSGGVDGGSA